MSLDCNFPFVQQSVGFDTVTRTLSAFVGTIGNLVKASKTLRCNQRHSSLHARMDMLKGKSECFYMSISFYCYKNYTGTQHAKMVWVRCSSLRDAQCLRCWLSWNGWSIAISPAWSRRKHENFSPTAVNSVLRW